MTFHAHAYITLNPMSGVSYICHTVGEGEGRVTGGALQDSMRIATKTLQGGGGGS